MDEVREAADPGKRVVLVCNMGGNLDPTYAPSKFGMQSRRGASHRFCSWLTNHMDGRLALKHAVGRSRCLIPLPALQVAHGCL